MIMIMIIIIINDIIIIIIIVDDAMLSLKYEIIISARKKGFISKKTQSTLRRNLAKIVHREKCVC